MILINIINGSKNDVLVIRILYSTKKHFVRLSFKIQVLKFRDDSFEVKVQDA